MSRRTTPQLVEAVERYITILKLTRAQTTVSNVGCTLRRMAREIGPTKQLHTLQHHDVEQWFAAEVSRTEPATSNKVAARARLFFRFAMERGWIDQNLMSQIGTRRVPEKNRLRLNRQQLVELIESTENPRDRAFIALGINTALRGSDVIRLRVQDLDLEGGWLSLVVLKTGKAERLPVTSDLEREMRRWLVWYSERLALLGRALDPADYLVPALTPGSVRHGDDVHLLGDPRPAKRMGAPERIVNRALERLGIDGGEGQTGCHTLRRSTARVLYDQLVDRSYDDALRVVAALLGHSSIQVTETYLGVQHDRVKRDEWLRGRSFLTLGDNVTPLRRAD